MSLSAASRAKCSAISSRKEIHIGIIDIPQSSPPVHAGGFFFGFCGVRRVLTGERFNPTLFGTARVSEPNEQPIDARSVFEGLGE